MSAWQPIPAQVGSNSDRKSVSAGVSRDSSVVEGGIGNGPQLNRCRSAARCRGRPADADSKTGSPG
eukprot:1025479-Prymnesium_polylepis.1